MRRSHRLLRPASCSCVRAALRAAAPAQSMMRRTQHAGVRAIALLCVMTVGASRLIAQSPAVSRGLELEQAGKMREAIVAYREALRSPEFVQGLLGIERAYAE